MTASGRAPDRGAMTAPNKRSFEALTRMCSNETIPSTWFGPLDKYPMRGQAARVVKDKPAVLGGWWLHNRSAGARFVNFYDQAAEPKDGDEADFVVTLDPGPTWAALPIPFYRGLAFTVTGDGRDPAGDVSGLLLFA